jgi:hypothetical protein
MTRRKKTGQRRGRPYNPHARRHQTTRAGRRGERDLGAVWLRAKKRAATGREDVEMTPAGVLYGQGHLDNAQYSALGWVTQLLQRIARSFGQGMSPVGVWAAIIAAASRTAPGMPPSSAIMARGILWRGSVGSSTAAKI